MCARGNVCVCVLCVCVCVCVCVCACVCVCVCVETLPVNEGNRDARHSIKSYEYSTQYVCSFQSGPHTTIGFGLTCAWLQKSGASFMRSPAQSGSRDMLDISLLQTCRLAIHKHT